MISLHTQKDQDHTEKLIDLFKAVIWNGLKMSPRKCKTVQEIPCIYGINNDD